MTGRFLRRIERWIDGDATARRKLDSAPSSIGKTTRRVIKYALYLTASTIIAHVFISYFVSLPRLYQFMREGPLQHGATFTIIISLTAVLYFCFSWFREQFCIILCPYGRIQSALTDEETVVIGYDAKRGEPRGKVSDPNAGHCIVAIAASRFVPPESTYATACKWNASVAPPVSMPVTTS
jgi:polyferredoxin